MATVCVCGGRRRQESEQMEHSLEDEMVVFLESMLQSTILLAVIPTLL